MKTATEKPLQFFAPLKVQFRAVPTRWIPKLDKLSGEPCLVPAVNQNIERKLARVVDPDDLRRRFLKMRLDEESALNFLNEVGVWSTIEGDTQDGPDGSLLSESANVGIREQRMLGAFGNRFLIARASIETTTSLREEQAYWKSLLRNPAKLRRAFRASPDKADTPAHKSVFAINSTWGNTLPLHCEWRGKHAEYIIQPITFRELLIALAWVDLITSAPFKVCHNANCAEPYTRGGTKFCCARCEKASRMRAYRRAKKEGGKTTQL